MSGRSILSRRAWLAGAPLAAWAARTPVRLPQKVRLALIGVEGHMNEITANLGAAPDVEFVAVSDPDAKAAAHFARGPLAGLRQYTDYRRMLDREKLDMVAVAAPKSCSP
jgi:predicted dehydrogenase